MATSGIGIIKNIENEKIFAFKSFNLEKQWEIYQKQLNLDIHHILGFKRIGMPSVVKILNLVLLKKLMMNFS